MTDQPSPIKSLCISLPSRGAELCQTLSSTHHWPHCLAEHETACLLFGGILQTLVRRHSIRRQEYGIPGIGSPRCGRGSLPVAGAMDLVQVGQMIFLAVVTVVFYVWLRSRRVEQSTEQVRGVRLHLAYRPDERDIESELDIIAIHGLDTKSPQTWIWRLKEPHVNHLAEPRKAGINWLEDRDMLPQQFPTARIYYCDWPADLQQQPHLIQKTLEEFAELLLTGIQSRPLATNDQRGRGDRPIVFVASCLGGIILMKALVDATNEYLPVRRATRGIVFLATPFRGTSFQDVANWAEPGLKAWASIQGRQVSKLLDSVKGSTFQLERLVREFTALCQDKDYPIQVFNFYEMRTTSLPRKVFPWLPVPLQTPKPVRVIEHSISAFSTRVISVGSRKLLTLIQLVDRSSATLDIVPHPIPLDRHHVEMNKFFGPDDQGYEAVAQKLGILLHEIREKRPINVADAEIRETRYAVKELMIERLSGEPLRMDQCYINLAIVEQPGETATCSKDEVTMQQSSLFSLFDQLKVEKLDKEIEVSLPTLFEPRTAHDGRMRPPGRILIRGRAGVGKTTLCKKIVHDFTYGTLWENLFDRLLWVPLRNLKLKERLQTAGYNFYHLFRDEYFSQQPTGDFLAKTLWGELDSRSDRTLFILDGLDEVSQKLDGAMHVFLRELLNQPNVIITSRPFATLPSGLDLLDIDLETIGFYPDQVKDYLQNALPIRADEIQSFLQEHPLLQGLVRIPILLDALCYTWDSLGGKNMPQTMTAIYTDIELSLWKKDAVKLERGTGSQMKDALSREVRNSVKNEICLLEVLAFNGMYNAIIDFEPDHRDALSEQYTPTDTGPFIDETLARLSFLRTSNPSSKDRTYHFLHLTFQEYFAARYFVRQWMKKEPLKCQVLSNGKSKEILPAKFIGMQKYNARYDILWRFVAGLLLDQDEDQLCYFFKTIADEPRDLLGPAHQRLLMHCFSELPLSYPLKHLQAEMVERCRKWALYEYKLLEEMQLCRETEFPDEALDEMFATEPDQVKIGILQALHGRSQLSLGLRERIADILRDANSDVQKAAAEVLGKQPSLPDNILEALMSRLEDADSSVSSAAAKALGNQSYLPYNIRQDLASRLEDGESGVRAGAARALGNQSSLPENILRALVDRLSDKTGVRFAAALALSKQSSLPDHILKLVVFRSVNTQTGRAAIEVLGKRCSLPDSIFQFLVSRLDHESWRVRTSAAEVLGKRPSLPDNIIQVLVSRLVEDTDRGVQSATIKALGNQSSLPDQTIQALVSQVKGCKSSRIRRTTAEALGKQSSLSHKILDNTLQALVALLEDTDLGVRINAAEALGKRASLPDNIIQVLVSRLVEDTHAVARSAAAEALGNQSCLPDHAIQALVSQMKDRKSSHIRRAAVEALGKQSSLPDNILDNILHALVALLEDTDLSVRITAIEALSNKSPLTDNILQALLSQLEDAESGVRRAAVKALGKQRSLSNNIIQALVSRLENADLYLYRRRQATYTDLQVETILLKNDSFYSILPCLHGHTLRTIYRRWVTMSIRVQFSCYIQDQILHIHLPDGQTKLISLQQDNDELQKEFLTEALAMRSPNYEGEVLESVLSHSSFCPDLPPSIFNP